MIEKIHGSYVDEQITQEEKNIQTTENEKQKNVEKKENYTTLIDSWLKKQAVTPFLNKMDKDLGRKPDSYSMRFNYVQYLHYKGIKLFETNKYAPTKVEKEKSEQEMKKSVFAKHDQNTPKAQIISDTLFFSKGITSYIGQPDQDREFWKHIQKNEHKLRNIGIDDNLFQ